MNPTFAVQVRTLAKRSIARTLRQPVLIVPGVVFPLFMLAVLSAAGAQVTKIPGFPTHSYLTFIIASTMIQGATGAMTMAGNALGSDIQTGFLSRLALTPIKVGVLVVAQLAGIAVLGVVQTVLYLVVAVLFGANVKAGVGGAIVVVVVMLLIVLAFASVGLLAAVRTGSAEQVQGLSALGLGLLFMSSMVMPRNLISSDWFKEITTYNPMSYLVEAPRSLFITGWDGQALALGCGIAVAILVLALAAAIASLNQRILRT